MTQKRREKYKNGKKYKMIREKIKIYLKEINENKFSMFLKFSLYIINSRYKRL